MKSMSKGDFGYIDENRMKVLIVNTSEFTGGAAVAANRLMKALRKADVEVTMLVRDKISNSPCVLSLNDSFFSRKLNFIRFVWERLVIFLSNHLRRKPLFQVSIANTGTDISSHPLVREADIIHLHWINQGFLSLTDIRTLVRTGKPIVWTMHDMWPCTAICHHSFGCEQFKEECGECPFLRSHKHKDLAYSVFHKKRFLADSKIQLVAVSTWLRKQAQDSALTNRLPVEVIPNVIDTSLFVPSDKEEARKGLSLPLDKKIILMGAARINDPIKGFEYLVKALSILKERKGEEDYFLVLFGGIKGNDSFLSEIPIPYVWMGSLSDPSMIAKLYAAADVTVVASLYETFGQTIIEGMACGCPAVSFDNSGQTDIINHLENGYLAKYKDTDDLATGIKWVIDNREPLRLNEACIRKVHDCYKESIIAKKYIALYQSLCNKRE